MNIYSVETHSHHDEYILDDRGVRSVIFIHGDIHYNHHGPNASRTMSEIREYQRGKKTTCLAVETRDGYSLQKLHLFFCACDEDGKMPPTVSCDDIIS